MSAINHVNNFISKKLQDINIHTQLPNKKKFLTIIACHVDTKEKLLFIKNNINYLMFENNDIIIINTIHLKLNQILQKEISDKVFKYIEIENNKWYDFGKWLYVLNHIDYSNYDFITFTNDSFLICKSVLPFFNEAVHNNVELYAYTSSSEVKYHYQSYLFIIKKQSIIKLIGYIQKYINTTSPNPIFLEIYLLDQFFSKKCFLNIGIMPLNIKKNVFFNNDFLYFRLFDSSLLPFIKMKRLYSKANTRFKYNLSFFHNASNLVQPTKTPELTI